MKRNAAEKSVCVAGAALVVLACFAADQRTRAWFVRDVPRVVLDVDGRRTREQTALGQVVGLRDVIRDPFDEPLRTNPDRGRAEIRHQPVAFRVLTGGSRGRLAVADNVLQFKPSSNAPLKRGSLAHLQLSEADGVVRSAIIAKPLVRFPQVFQTTAVLLMLVILFVKVRGVMFAGALAATALAASWLLFPQILDGKPPLAVTALYGAVVMAALLLTGGRFGRKAARKAAAALLGSAAGLAVAVIVVLVMSAQLRLSGLASTSALFLDQITPSDSDLDFARLAACGTLIAILGLTLDLGISVASGVEQLVLAQPNLPHGRALRAGLRMHRDIAGTMMLTLVFVWMGGNVHALMLPRGVGLSLREIINSEATSIELLRLVGGGIGLLATGPATVFVSAWLLRRRAPRAEARDAPSRPFGLYVLACVEVALCAALAFVAVGDIKARRSDGVTCEPIPTLTSADAYHREGAARMGEGRLNEAAVLYWRALDLAPNHGPATRDLARLYAEKRWFALAQHEAEKALALMPSDSSAHYVAGVIAAWLQQTDDAQRHLRKAARLDPGNEAAAQALEQLFGEKPQPHAHSRTK